MARMMPKVGDERPVTFLERVAPRGGYTHVAWRCTHVEPVGDGEERPPVSTWKAVWRWRP